MCEWLSAREWSDVRLQCGGRSLPAHRAVLASASAFLRCLLLSSEPEETPTFIVLPDFDLEAMSSVLYYIYNGEVVIQKQKMEMFMDIVKAMQIFVDEDYLPSACRDITGVALSSTINDTTLDKSKVFSLGSDSEGAFINIKKGIDIDKCSVRSINKDVDKRDKLRSDDGIQLSSVRSVELLGDRQRSSFRRDLFIEAYPRNGNANGRSAGVLEISNSHYQDAASVLSTNANDKHLRPDEAPVGMQNSTNVLRPSSIDKQNLALIAEKMNAEYAHLVQFKCLSSSYNPRVISENDFYSWMNLPVQQSQILLSGSKNAPYLDLRRSEPDIVKKCYGSSHSILENSLHDRMVSTNSFQDQFNFTKCMTRDLSSFTSRRAILNQVMESPWCARPPSNYRPLMRRSLIDKIDVLRDSPKENVLNDSNNNLTIPLNPENLDQNISNMKVTSISTSEFKCTVCNQVFRDSETLSSHARRHSAPARYSCTECSKSFSQLRNFKYHMSIHRGTREFAATCTVCGKYFNDRGYLSSHMKIHRNRKEYKCSQCPKSFNQRVAYNMHVRIHTGIKPHVCGECGKAFSRKMLLKQHQRTHSGERPYACPHCDKRFADRSNMTLHLRLHSGIKPFSCSLCSKSFTKKHHLKSHLNFHTGSKPYSCPRCKLSFTQSSNMRTHYKKCTAPEVITKAETSAS